MFQYIQAPLLKKYPASLSVTAYSYFFGALFMVVTAFVMTNESTDWSLTKSELFAVCYAVSFSLMLNEGFRMIIMFLLGEELPSHLIWGNSQYCDGQSQLTKEIWANMKCGTVLIFKFCPTALIANKLSHDIELSFMGTQILISKVM